MPLRAACASILIAAVLAPGAFAQDSLAALDGCLRRLDPQSDYAQSRCPELVPRLKASEAAAWLPEGWSSPNNELSAANLRELRQLLAHERALRAPSRPPDLVSLSSILSELGPLQRQNSGAWGRFTSWLRKALERPGPASAPSWWELVRASPSQTAIDFICYACLAVVVLMAVALVANELRVAGAFAPHRRSRITSGSRVRPATLATPDWSAIQNVPTRERPRLLLELISARLVDLNRLPPAGAFTVRELMQQARLAQHEDHSLLADVALAAERLRFSGEAIPATSLEAVIEAGRRLLEHLSS